MDHRFILAGITGYQACLVESAAAHLAKHFSFEIAPFPVAPTVIDVVKERGAPGLVVTEFHESGQADWIRANGGIVIHLRSNDVAEIVSISYRWKTDRFVIDFGSRERFLENLEDVVVEAIKTMQRAATRKPKSAIAA